MSLLSLINKNPHFHGKRKISLYSNFRRLKEANIDGYEANIAAWKSVLLNAVESGAFNKDTSSNFIIPVDSDFMHSLYDPEYGIPLALDCVFDELVEDKVLVPLSAFKTYKYSVYAGQGIMSWVWTKVLGSKWTSAAAGSSYKELKVEKYIYLKGLDDIAGKVWSNLESPVYSRAIYTKEMVYDFLKPILPNPDVVDLVLLYLSRDKPHISIRGEIVKATRERSEINDRDEAVATLCSTIHKLSKKVDSLSERLDKDSEKSKVYAKRGNKALAKYYLRSKKITEKTQEDCLVKLENVEVLLSKVDSAMDDEIVVQALSDGNELMKSVQRAIGGLDKVEKLVEEFKDHVLTTDEISEQLYDISTVPNISDADLEDELKELEAEEADQTRNEPSKLPATLPSVPQNAPADDPRESRTSSTELTDQLGDLSLEEVKESETKSQSTPTKYNHDKLRVYA